jgi:hypothetical protein
MQNYLIIMRISRFDVLICVNTRAVSFFCYTFAALINKGTKKRYNHNEEKEFMDAGCHPDLRPHA